MSPPDGAAGLHRLGMRQVPPRLRPLTAAEFLMLNLPPRGLILDPWLPTQGLAMIHSARGVGKTHLALGIAYAVATGSRLLGWTAPEPRRVTYLDGEMPAATMQTRTAAIIAGAMGTRPPTITSSSCRPTSQRAAARSQRRRRAGRSRCCNRPSRAYHRRQHLDVGAHGPRERGRRVAACSGLGARSPSRWPQRALHPSCR